MQSAVVFDSGPSNHDDLRQGRDPLITDRRADGRRPARTLSTDFIIGMGTYDGLFTERVDASVYLDLADAVSADRARAAIHRALKPYQTTQLRDQAAAVQARASAVDQILGLVTALLAFTVLIAMLGITNTGPVHRRTHPRDQVARRGGDD